MSKLTEKTDILKSQIWGACDELDKLKIEITGGGLNEKSFPAIAELQKRLMSANVTASQLLEHVLGI